MSMMAGDERERLDPSFYRGFYEDLAGFDDAFLVRHFEEHGRREGRLPNRTALFDALRAQGHVLPPDFDPLVYRRLYPDVDAQCATDWDVCRHFAEQGRTEGRRYVDFDPRFYWELYLSDRPFDREEVEEHYREHRDRPDTYASLETLLSHCGIRGQRWLEGFSAAEFSIRNFDWIGRTLNRAQAVHLFLTKGVERLARFGRHAEFDARFYRKLHPKGGSDAELYRHWLSEGCESGEAATLTDWMRSRKLPFEVYPRVFKWREYARRRQPKRASKIWSRWDALNDLSRSRGLPLEEIPVRGWPARGHEVREFLSGIGAGWLAHGLPHAAIPLLEAGDRAAINSARLAEAYYLTRRWSDALAAFAIVEAARTQTLQTICRASECHAREGHFDRALNLLAAHRPEHGGAQSWRQAVTDTIVRSYEASSSRARSLYRAGRKADADAEIVRAVGECEGQWRRFIDLPTPLPAAARANGPIAILANTALQQCRHYRVEQKVALLQGMGREVRCFDEAAVAEFTGALPGASAAIFYRVPALPSAVRAIITARALGIPTYYEIDDLIFDPAVYPPSIDTFGGQIDQDEHVELMHGVPLYRAAMALCDEGIASTPALAAAMAPIVRSGRVSVVRNGLDDRNIGQDGRIPSRPIYERPTVRILYGSATLAHNSEFNTLVAEALCTLMARNPGVELVIVGHLRLDPVFRHHRHRITTIHLLTAPEAFWSILSTCDINLAVLGNGPVSDAKSEIKWLEAAVLGIPSIVSATATYNDVVSHGVTGLLADTAEEWSAALEALVGDPQLRTRIGAAARAHVQQAYAPAVQSRALATALDQPLQDPTSRPRILIVNVFFPPQAVGGATRVVAANIDDWLDDGTTDEFAFAIATLDHLASPAYSRKIEAYREIPVFRIAAPEHPEIDWAPKDAGMADWFRGVLAAFRPDLVHFHCVQRLTTSAIDVCAEAGIPYLVSIHDAWWLSDYQFLVDEEDRLRSPGDEALLGSRRGVTLTASIERQRLLREALDGASAILAPSERFADLYREQGFAATRTIGNGIGALASPARRPSASGRVRLGHVGNTSVHKGIHLIEAALRQGVFANLELVALDHGRRDGTRHREIWGSTPVEIRGPVAQHLMGELYAELDVLLAPSVWPESFGLVTREAHAAGLWVVASDRGAIGEDLRDGIDGFVIDVATPIPLMETLARINADPARFLASPPTGAVRSALEQARDIADLYRKLLA